MSLRQASEASHNFSATVAATTPVVMVPVPSNLALRSFIYRLILTLAGTAGTVQLQDTSGNNLSQPFQLGVTGGVSLDVPFNLDPWWWTGQNPAVTNGRGLGVQAAIAGGGTLGWDVWYAYF